jgi:Tn3 transposase DDE domain
MSAPHTTQPPSLSLTSAIPTAAPVANTLAKMQLNRGERRHQLARRLFFANQGAFQTGDYEEIMNKATCLSLLSKAVVVWNTVQMTRLLEQLRASGDMIAAEDLARLSPLAFAHVMPNGTYFVRQSLLQSHGEDRGELRALRVGRPGEV